MKSMIVLIAITAAQQALAGSSQVRIACETSDKAIQLEAFFPGDEYGSQVVLKSSATTLAYLDTAEVQDAQANHFELQKEFPLGYDVVAIAAVNRPEINVLTLAVSRDGWTVFELAAIPATIKLKNAVARGSVGTFTAKVRTSTPSGKFKDLAETVHCTYDDTL